MENDRHGTFNFFFLKTATLSKGHVHIGLNDIEEEGKFINTDGSEPSWSNWYTTNPDGNIHHNCVIAYYNHNLEWDDNACSVNAGALIEIRSNQLKNECFEGRVIYI
jgi:hypothetical protein